MSDQEQVQSSNLRKPVEVKQKVQLTVSQLLKELEEGNNKRAIAAKYGIPLGEIKTLFEHPKLKGKKVKSKGSFELLDDTDDSVPVYKAPTKKAKVESAVESGAKEATTQESSPELAAAPSSNAGSAAGQW